MRERVDRVVHCWDDGLDYSVGARLDAEEIWRSVIDAWVNPDPAGSYHVGSERAERAGSTLLRLSLALVHPESSRATEDGAPD